ncbi:MAG: hypothetical protein ABIJ34_01180 [archaeon]
MFGRKINFFERILLPVGIGLTFLGLYLIMLAEQTNSLLGWLRLLTVFVWMLLLFTVIMSALSEDMKEELSLLQREHVTEIKLLKELVHEQLQELKLLRSEIKNLKK